MHTKIKIIGCGGHAKVVLDALFLSDYSYFISLCDSNEQLINTEFCGLLIDSGMDSLSDFVGLVHVCIGNNQVREAVYGRLHSAASPLTVIHPKTVISKSAILGEGSFIAAQAILAPESVIGRGCIVNHGAVVDHEVRIGDYSHIAPNCTLGGAVNIGKRVLVGAGAVVLPGISIGDDAIIAAGAVVIKNVKSHTTVKGVPAL